MLQLALSIQGLWTHHWYWTTKWEDRKQCDCAGGKWEHSQSNISILTWSCSSVACLCTWHHHPSSCRNQRRKASMTHPSPRSLYPVHHQVLPILSDHLHFHHFNSRYSCLFPGLQPYILSGYLDSFQCCFLIVSRMTSKWQPDHIHLPHTPSTTYTPDLNNPMVGWASVSSLHDPFTLGIEQFF